MGICGQPTGRAGSDGPSTEVIDCRLDDQFGNVGAGMKLYQEFHRRRDVVGLKDHGAPLCSNGNRSRVQNRRLDLAGIDHRRANAVNALLTPEADSQS